MGLITLICFYVITITTSITTSMMVYTLLEKYKLIDDDPVYLICIGQCIFTVVLVAGLMILGG